MSQVAADLRAGDVVEVRHSRFPDVVIRGPLTEEDGALRCGFAVVRHMDGGLPYEATTVTVVSRAPRPLYVNHDRTVPRIGDVVGWPGNFVTYGYADWYEDRGEDRWIVVGGTTDLTTPELVARAEGSGESLRLLVDGETGQVVP